MKETILAFIASIISLFFPNKQITPISSPPSPIPTIINQQGQPNYHLIETAFIPQAPEKNWDQPWQDACEESALLTIYYYYQSKNPSINEIKEDILKMIDYQKENNMEKDINLFQLQEISQKHLSLESQIIENPNIDDIKDQILLDRPILVPTSGKKLFQENKYFKNGGPYYHNIVILGYNDENKKFIVHDVGTQFGAYFQYSYELLLDAIHDFPSSLKKEDIHQGDKRILVLLK